MQKIEEADNENDPNHCRCGPDKEYLQRGKKNADPQQRVFVMIHDEKQVHGNGWQKIAAQTIIITAENHRLPNGLIRTLDFHQHIKKRNNDPQIACADKNINRPDCILFIAQINKKNHGYNMKLHAGPAGVPMMDQVGIYINQAKQYQRYNGIQAKSVSIPDMTQ